MLRQQVSSAERLSPIHRTELWRTMYQFPSIKAENTIPVSVDSVLIISNEMRL